MANDAVVSNRLYAEGVSAGELAATEVTQATGDAPNPREASVLPHGGHSTEIIQGSELHKGHGCWFVRIFSQGFAPEDLLLYVLSLVLIVFLWMTFSGLRTSEAELLRSLSGPVIDNWKPESPNTRGAGLGALNENDMNFLRSQVVITAMRYQQGSITTAALSTRKNLGFMVGTIIAIIGCIVVIRGVREILPIEAKGALKDRAEVALTTSSPGVFIVFMGSIIILATVLTSGDRPELKDEPITYTPRQIVSPASSALGPAGAPPVTPTVQATPTPGPTPSF